LDALLPRVEKGVQDVALAQLRTSPLQPRRTFDEAAIAELAGSVAEKGVLQPIVVRPVDGGFEVVAGERRYRAAQRAGLSTIPAVVRKLNDQETLEIAIIENLQREDLNAVEETEAVLGLLEISLNLDATRVTGLLQALYNEERGRVGGREIDDRQRGAVHALFRRLGRFTVSSFVSNRLPILEFPESLLNAVRNGKLAFTKAQAIARVEDQGDRERLLAVALAEDLSLSQIRRRITELRAARAGSRTTHQNARGGGFEQAQRLVTSTKKLLNKRRLASLDAERLQRVSQLLEELQTTLQDV